MHSIYWACPTVASQTRLWIRFLLWHRRAIASVLEGGEGCRAARLGVLSSSSMDGIGDPLSALCTACSSPLQCMQSCDHRACIVAPTDILSTKSTGSAIPSPSGCSVSNTRLRNGAKNGHIKDPSSPLHDFSEWVHQTPGHGRCLCASRPLCVACS